MNKYILMMISNFNKSDYSLFVVRVVFGLLMFINHGIFKITAGTEKWKKLGSVVTDIIGFEFLNIFFGFMAAFSESICAIFIVLGLFNRPASILLFVTMVIASMKHFIDGSLPELAMLYCIFCLGLILSGPGRYSLDYMIFWKYNK